MKVYDFGLSWSGNILERFVKFIKIACREKGLSFIWVSESVIKNVIKKLETGEIKINLLLDTEATYNKPGDIYARLCYAVKDAGGVVINDPDRAKMAVDKSVMHFELMNRGILLPYTVVVRSFEPYSFKLGRNEKKRLNPPFIIKPASGYGQMGVLRNAKGKGGEIARARKYDRNDNFLLQEKIQPIHIKGKRAWFRVFQLFDTLIPCWWDDLHNLYEHVTIGEFRDYKLMQLAKIVAEIAETSRMVWFSTEIAIDRKFGRRRFVTIDYINDQCDMTTKSETSSGVPDRVVEFTAKAFVKAATRLIKNRKDGSKYTIWLKDATIRPRGFRSPPEALRQG